MSEQLKQYTAIKFNFRGKAIKQLEATGVAMLKLWALQNTNGKSKTVIMESETNEIIMIVEGAGTNHFPKVYKTKEEIESYGIEVEVIK